jgi:CDP-glucose 4,6-dehydratase
MENMVNPTFWAGKRVFLTGHTGFKGAWLAFWLVEMGAHVHGYALPPQYPDNLFDLLGLPNRLASSTLADIRDGDRLHAAMQVANPDILFHLAAQALVPAGYRQPVETFSVNVVGTAQVLECARLCKQLVAAAIITSDKCYENNEWPWGYRESDPMGGHDPYSASKGAAELVVASYRRSFLTQQGVAVATMRAGNVIGGGDRTPSRLIPDALTAFQGGTTLHLRNPYAVRPWQHVLDPLHGYLQLSERLFQNGSTWAEAWNFGPNADDAVPVQDVVNMIASHWPTSVRWSANEPNAHPHEAQRLRLDCSKTRQRLGWRPVWDGRTAIQKTVAWHLADRHERNLSACEITRQQLSEFLLDTRQMDLGFA